jgi:hypothetical protein
MTFKVKIFLITKIKDKLPWLLFVTTLTNTAL